MNQNTDDIRIKTIDDVASPTEVHNEFPITEQAARITSETRHTIHEILQERDDRLLVIVGPCSIHDPKGAKEYADQLKAMQHEFADDLLIVMRVYFEKPRTTVGWKGLINDPDLNESFQINKGLRLARSLLLDLNNMGIPAGTEFLDVITPQYVTDLVSWGAIGARTTESQVHRELASGLSCPVGLKNGTDGNLKIAVDAIGSAMRPHHFLSVTKQARAAIVSTMGNEDCHIILRGGKSPNYHRAGVEDAVNALEKAGLPTRLMIDFSHSNSRKIPERQLDVGRDVAHQIADGDRRIFGAMIEGYFSAGRQDVTPDKELTYGQSITDACIGWDDTALLLRMLANAVQQRRKS
uniref:Phospho-2-dehydro-3-deoxyheptonate aldolase n=1 Tax=Candidatus Kentrum sp. TUN TaxID=2126343 RepID=A0A450ZVB3_9GAMM|nr:MAG: 3-deoxy-D-arabinoheptulosonate-7-phosphate synthase [Candidatus Kentron sp. TUN]VFK57721.1 MAG: 3-deoxy-D-arabinoheptulosonate-7-phosphate synthase [Candidatus Kentron sp. TUN]VFK65841.1 MAG: 3-deoxy-D-arabinoheptulosonate-7-phosphate synthase [Candidatus Kentron sp. TUN]